jgi:8-amino-3,8-dideoxy-alpha-D-manno-octulosonate transaminase
MNEFEKDICKKFNVEYAQATSSGTAGLKVALQALGIGKGDEVITQSHTFIATVEAIVSCGAIPVIADIDKSLNIDINSFKSLITKKTKAVIPVHMYGVSCDMEKIMNIANGSSIKVLEDSCQAIGGKYKNRYLGTFGDAGVYSFDSGKIIPLGEGGMIVTNNQVVYEKARAICNHGHAYSDKPRGQDDMMCIGFNYKMSELIIKEGIIKFRNLDKLISRFKENKNKLAKGLEYFPEIQNLNFRMRDIIDDEGDVGNAICLIFSNVDDAKSFSKEWNNLGYNTFNLPDAFKWHFAGEWKHIPMKHNGLEKSRNILECTVAIPVKQVMYDIEEFQNVVRN